MTLASFLSPACFLLLVGATYSLGKRYGTRVAVAAALLLLSHPLAIGLMAYPTRALPASTLLVTSIAAATGTARRHALVGGIAAGAAIGIEPRVAPLALVVALFLLFRPERSSRQRVRTLWEYAVPCVVGVIAAISMRAAPATAGVGAVGLTLVSVFWVLPVLMAFAAPFLVPGALSTLLIGCMLANVVSYVLTVRGASDFGLLTPALAITMILAMETVDAAWRRNRLPGPAIAVAVAAVCFITLEYTV